MAKPKVKTKKQKPARGKKLPAKTSAKAKKPVKGGKPAREKRAAGLPEQLRDAALKVLDERKAAEIVVVDLHGKSSVADYLIVASGHASRQIVAIAHYLKEAFEKLAGGRIRIEGMAQANWVLVDCGDIVVHLFRPEVRRYYNIENLWQDEKADIGHTPLVLE